MSSKISRPIINIDLDNCVYDFSYTMQTEGERVLGRPLSSTSWNIWEDWGIPFGLWQRIFREGVAAGRIWGDDQPPLGKAVEALWELSDAEYYIRILSHRLNHGFDYKEAVIHTAEWLDRFKIPYRSFCVIGPESKANYRADALVDDAVHNIEDWWANDLPNGILMDRPWNQGFQWEKRAQNWAQVVALIKEGVPRG